MITDDIREFEPLSTSDPLASVEAIIQGLATTGYIASRVQQAGVAKFEDLGLCTYAEPERFYSFRRSTHQGEPDYGRHINAIALTE